VFPPIQPEFSTGAHAGTSAKCGGPSGAGASAAACDPSNRKKRAACDHRARSIHRCRSIDQPYSRSRRQAPGRQRAKVATAGCSILRGVMTLNIDGLLCQKDRKRHVINLVTINQPAVFSFLRQFEVTGLWCRGPGPGGPSRSSNSRTVLQEQCARSSVSSLIGILKYRSRWFWRR